MRIKKNYADLTNTDTTKFAAFAAKSLQLGASTVEVVASRHSIPGTVADTVLTVKASGADTKHSDVVEFATALEGVVTNNPLHFELPVYSAEVKAPVFIKEPIGCKLPADFGVGIEKSAHGHPSGCESGGLLPRFTKCKVTCKQGYTQMAGDGVYMCMQTLNKATLICEPGLPQAPGFSSS